jgi:hypothetical protein
MKHPSLHDMLGAGPRTSLRIANFGYIVCAWAAALQVQIWQKVAHATHCRRWQIEHHLALMPLMVSPTLATTAPHLLHKREQRIDRGGAAAFAHAFPRHRGLLVRHHVLHKAASTRFDRHRRPAPSEASERTRMLSLELFL